MYLFSNSCFLVLINNYLTFTDLRALTPRSVSAMVSSKVSAEDQAQLQAISQSHQASLASMPSKVSIAPLVLSSFLKPTNTTIHNHSQQFQQTRPASAAASSDVTVSCLKCTNEISCHC